MHFEICTFPGNMDGEGTLQILQEDGLVKGTWCKLMDDFIFVDDHHSEISAVHRHVADINFNIGRQDIIGLEKTFHTVEIVGKIFFAGESGNIGFLMGKAGGSGFQIDDVFVCDVLQRIIIRSIGILVERAAAGEGSTQKAD